MHFHGLLDWRLGVDLLDILRSGTFNAGERWAEHGQAVVQEFATQFEGFEYHEVAGAPAANDEDVCVIGIHPFAERDESRLTEQVAEAIYEARDLMAANGHHDGRIVLHDFFNLLRRPGWSYASLWSS
jgi:hypothetical protein